MENLRLTKDENYKIRLHPSYVKLNGQYMGNYNGDLGKTHVFENIEKEKKNYILVADQWMENAEEVISHKSHFSFAVQVIPEKNIFRVKGL